MSKRAAVLAAFLACLAVACLSDAGWAQGMLISAEESLYGGPHGDRPRPNFTRPVSPIWSNWPTSPVEPPLVTALPLNTRRPLIPPSVFNRLPPSGRRPPIFTRPTFPVSFR